MAGRTVVPFWYAILVHLALAASGGMIIAWTVKYLGGLDAKKDSLAFTDFAWFNKHFVFMIFAFVICGGEASVAYRVWPFSHNICKLIHAFFHTSALALGSYGLYNTVEVHKKLGFKQFYSWLGITVFAWYAFKFIISVPGFALPNFPPSDMKARIIPLHKTFGRYLYVFITAATVTGLQQWQTLEIDVLHGGLDSAYFLPLVKFTNPTAIVTVFACALVLGSHFFVRKDNDSFGDAPLTQRLLY